MRNSRVMSDPFVSWLQSRLTSHGFAVGLIDGDLGPVTTAALQAFQASLKVSPTGTADAKTVELLRQSSSQVPAAVKAAIPDRDKVEAPAAAQRPVDARFPRQADVEKVFGAVGTNQTAIEIPFDMVLAWQPSTRVGKMTLHRKVAPSALRVLQRVAGLYSAAERHALGIDLFGGSLNVRRMRGGTKFSMHAWGIAIDFDPTRNMLHTHAPQARLSHADAQPFWAAWEAEGWLSLGRARDFDWMHVQAARL